MVKYFSHAKPYKVRSVASTLKIDNLIQYIPLTLQRAGIFPWGGGNQKGPEGEKVVSARAIKHVRELTEIAQGNKCISRNVTNERWLMLN